MLVTIMVIFLEQTSLREGRSGAAISERRGTEDGHTELRGHRGKVDHLALGNDAHGVLSTARETDERHPQS